MRWSIRVRVIALVGIFVLLMVVNFLVLRAWIQGSVSTGLPTAAQPTPGGVASRAAISTASAISVDKQCA